MSRAGLLVLLASLAVSAPAKAVEPCAGVQPSTRGPRAQFGRHLRCELQGTQALFDLTRSRRESRELIFDNVAIETPAVDPATGLTSKERASAVVSTGVEGVKAGVHVKPFALAGVKSLDGLGFTLAALESGGTRAGTQHVWSATWDSTRLADLGLWCDLDTAKERKRVANLEHAFVRVCERLQTIERPNELDLLKRWVAARFVCGGPVPESALVALGEARARYARTDLGVTYAAGELTSFVETYEEAYGKAALADIAESAAALASYAQQTPLDCFEEHQIKKRVADMVWRNWDHNLAVGASVDLFPFTFGFDPDEDPRLPDANDDEDDAPYRPQAWQAQVEAKHSRYGYSVGYGAAFKRSREKIEDDMHSSIEPYAQVSMPILGHALDEKGRLMTDPDGTARAALYLGLQARVDVPFDPPDSMTGSFQGATFMPFLDLKVSKDLSVRVAAPLKATLKTRAAKPATAADPSADPPLEALDALPEKRALQWSVPVTVFTVFKL